MEATVIAIQDSSIRFFGKGHHRDGVGGIREIADLTLISTPTRRTEPSALQLECHIVF